MNQPRVIKIDWVGRKEIEKYKIKLLLLSEDIII